MHQFEYDSGKRQGGSSNYNGTRAARMTVDVRDKKQLEKLLSSMRRRLGVRDVERLVN